MSTIEEIIKMHNPTTASESKSILREIIQSIVLVGLSKTSFFSKACFYGGTALRKFYNLNRYSEDLDFTLTSIDDDFTINPYIPSIKNLALSYGLDLDIKVKEKGIKTPVESAFAKLNTYQAFIDLKLNNDLTKLLHKDETIKVKFEIDCHPALGFKSESRWIDMPEFAPIVVLDESSLFAGKLHAVLSRNYKNTVKGRDYYDFLFYVTNGVSPNLEYLRNKLIDSKKIEHDDPFDTDILRDMLVKKFEQVDFDQVKRDAERFVINNEDLSHYCKDLFIQMAKKIK